MGNWTTVTRSVAILALCLTLNMLLCSFTPSECRGEAPTRIELGFRAGVTGLKVFGRSEIEDFQAYQLTAGTRLPWGIYSVSGWGVGTKVQLVGGLLHAADTTGFEGGLLAGITIGKENGDVELFIGTGAVGLSEYNFGRQTLGGPFQVPFEVGVKLYVYHGLRVGYTFHHVSDAEIYHDKTPGHSGIDLHMLEVNYRF